MNPPGERSRKKASINKEGKEASGEKADGGKAMHLCAAKCKPRGECRQKGVGNPFFIQGNTAQFTAEALSAASLADFPATVTKMLANTLCIREHFCLTCKKICRRDSTLRIVRCCPKITPRRPAGPVPRRAERSDRRRPPCAANGAAGPVHRQLFRQADRGCSRRCGHDFCGFSWEASAAPAPRAGPARPGCTRSTP